MNPDRRLRALRQLAWAAVALMIVVTSVSAWLRLAQPRPPCPQWPVCRALGMQLPAPATLDAAPPAHNLDLPRALHRTVASLTLVLVCVLVAVALARRPRNWRAGRPALALLGLALGLAALGIATTGAHGAAILLGNMLGGFSMLALAWRMTRRGVPLDGAVARDIDRRALIGITGWAGQAAVGAISGTGAGLVVAWLHPVFALVVSVWALSLGAFVRRHGLFREGTALMVVTLLQWPLGIGAALLDAPPLLVLIHNTSAACGMALLAGLIGRGTARVGIRTGRTARAAVE